MFKSMKKFMGQAGMAIDEIVLSGIMLAGLASFAAISIPWGNITSANAQMLSILDQIETANSEFFDRYHVWPHQTTNGNPRNNAYALVSSSAMRYPYDSMLSFTSLLPDIDTSKNKSQLRHNFGAGGTIEQRLVTRNDGKYIEVILTGVPWKDARRLDEKVDKSYDPTNGKIRIMFDNKKQELVNVYYQANVVSKI